MDRSEEARYLVSYIANKGDRHIQDTEIMSIERLDRLVYDATIDNLQITHCSKL